MAKPKKVEVVKGWRWLVTHLFGQNMGFWAFIGEELVAKAEELTVTDLPQEFIATKFTSIHFDPKSGQHLTMPFMLEALDMVHPITRLNKTIIPYLQFPTESLLVGFEDAWKKLTDEEIETAKKKIAVADESMVLGAAAEAEMRKGVFQHLRGGK